MKLPLNPCRAAFGKSLHLLKSSHGRVTREGGQKRAVRPAQVDRFLFRLAAQQAVEEPGREAIPAADPVVHIQLAGGRDIGLAVDPGHSAPAMVIGGMHLTQGGGNHLDLRIFTDDLVDHPEECARIELGFGGDLGTGDAEPHLQVFLIPDQHVHVLHDAADDRLGAFRSAPDVPQFGAVVQVEGGHRPGSFGSLHAFDDDFAGRFRERGKDPAAVQPAHPVCQDGVPVEVTGLELGGGFIGAVVKDHRGAHAVAAVAVDGGHVGAVHAVVLEMFVEGSDSHQAHTFGDQIADGVIHHGRDHARAQAEAVGQVGGHVVLAAAGMHPAIRWPCRKGQSRDRRGGSARRAKGSRARLLI